MMKKSLLVAAALPVPLAYGECARAYPEHIEEGFVSLFNGTDLTGWTGDTAIYGVDPKEPGVLQCCRKRLVLTDPADDVLHLLIVHLYHVFHIISP